MNEILKHTWLVLSKEEKRKFIWLSAAAIFISITDIIFLAGLLWIVHFYIDPGASIDQNVLPSFLVNKQSASLIGLFFILFCIKNFIAYKIVVCHYRFSGDVAIRISQYNLLEYQQAEFENYVNIDSSVHIRKICFQPFEFCQYILTGIQQIVTQVFLVSAAIIAIMIFNGKLFLLLFFMLLPPVVLLFYLAKNKLDKVKRNIRSSNENSFRHLLDALKGYIESNIYNKNRFFENRFIEQRKIFSRNLFSSISMQTLPPRIMEAFAVLGLFILITIATWTNNGGTDAFITIGAFIAAAYKIIPGIVRIINSIGQIKAYEFALTELITEAENPPDNKIEETEEITSFLLENISYNYGDKEVLNNISLSGRKGDFIGITGRSGLGKTTLLNILLGFIQPSSGTVHINGKAVITAKLKNFWPKISYVRQHNFLIHDTITKNVTLEESNHDEEKLIKSIKLSGLDNFLEDEAEGLHKIVMENGKNISGGQQQRIALARAIYHAADIFLLDEPLSELDKKSAATILSGLKQMAADGKIILMVTHDKESLTHCTKVVALDD